MSDPTLLSALAFYLRPERLSRFIVPEVLVPATAPWAVVAGITKAQAVPMFYDVRPGIYAADADLVVPAITAQTAAMVLLQPHGAVPEREAIQRACHLHEVPCIAEDLPPALVEPTLARWWQFYEACGPFVESLILPSQREGVVPCWTVFPLCASTTEIRDALVAELAAWGATPMLPLVSVALELTNTDAWGTIGDLAGARRIVSTGFSLSLTAADPSGCADPLAAMLGMRP